MLALNQTNVMSDLACGTTLGLPVQLTVCDKSNQQAAELVFLGRF